MRIVIRLTTTRAAPEVVVSVENEDTIKPGTACKGFGSERQDRGWST